MLPAYCSPSCARKPVRARREIRVNPWRMLHSSRSAMRRLARSIIARSGSQGSCPLDRRRLPLSPMARTESETLALDGHEVTISNPGKIFFADAGITKMDLVRYYLTVADGALLGVR